MFEALGETIRDLLGPESSEQQWERYYGEQYDPVDARIAEYHTGVDIGIEGATALINYLSTVSGNEPLAVPSEAPLAGLATAETLQVTETASVQDAGTAAESALSYNETQPSANDDEQAQILSIEALSTRAQQEAASTAAVNFKELDVA